MSDLAFLKRVVADATKGKKSQIMQSLKTPASVCVLVLLAGLLAGCISAPLDYPKVPSQSIPASADTTMGADALQWFEVNGDESGFLGLASGTDALGARLRMMEAAEASIDAQYFLIKPDRAGTLFAWEMLEAADRGVRVRFLIDDIFTPGLDRELTVLNSHPNIQVRLFNPIGNRSFKYGNYLLDFKRANRRMHNKSFVVDGAISIVGGRNIAEEYFDLQQDVIFDDYEVLAMGTVVEEISAGFDLFWNSELAVPMEAFGLEDDPDSLQIFHDQIKREAAASAGGAYQRAVNSLLIQRIVNDEVEPAVAEATLVTDSPEKLTHAAGDKSLATLATELHTRFNEATDEIIIVTPYFVPRKSGVEFIETLRSRGIDIIVITNSLASTNHLPVHSGYAKYRKRMLRAGVKLFEIKADEVGIREPGEISPQTLTLHSKASIIDRSTIFIGSLNFDPRSLVINSEMGLFIESAKAGPVFTDILKENLGKVTFQVTLNEENDLIWTYDWGGRKEVHHKEPLTTWGRRFTAGLYRLLPIESQL